MARKPYSSERPGGPESQDALERRNRELVILNTVAQALNASVDLETLMTSALARVTELLGLTTGWVLLLDDETGEPYLGAAQNLPPGLTDDPTRLTGGCYCLEVFRQGDLEDGANVDVVTCSRLKNLLDGTGGLRYHASIPLQARGRRLGVLNVASPEWQELDGEELRLLETVGDMLGLAIERAQLYARSLEAGAAEERNRLAREIHDTLAQGLTAIALQLETADVCLEPAEPEIGTARRAVASALGLVRHNLDEARRSVLDLRSAPLAGKTLGEALQTLVEASGEDVRVRFEDGTESRTLPSQVEAGLYRIAQEAVANARRHAAAREVRVRLDAGADSAELLVEDDGRGFDPEAVPEGCFGLVGLRERARLLGGRLVVRSSPGVGTRVEVSVPLAPGGVR